MATTANGPTACTDASGDVLSLEFSGTSDCADLRIEVYDSATGELLATGPVAHAGSNWSISFSAQASDFIIGDIACDQMLNVILKCRDPSPSQIVFSETMPVSCVDCEDCEITIDSVTGVPSPGSGLQSLTISGTAASCSVVKVVVATSGAPAVEGDAPVTNNQWEVVFNSGDPGVGTRLKSYDCQEIVSIDATCIDNDHECSAAASAEIACEPATDPGRCPDSARVIVTGPNNFSKVNPADAELECVPPGNYTIRCTTPSPVYRWRSNDILVTGANSTLQVVSVSGDTMIVSLTGGDNHHFSVTAEVSEHCEPVRTVAFHCGGSVDCVVSDWSDWSPCENNVQRRTRTVLVPPSAGGDVCPPLEEVRDCSDTVAVDCVVSQFSPWSRCVGGRQTRTRTVITPPSNGGRQCPNLTETRDCSDVVVNLCLLWMFVNLGLVIVTGVIILIALCSVGLTTLTAIAALASGGTLAAVFATLSAATVQLLITAAIFVGVTLLSVVLWIIVCLFGSLRDIVCELIEFLLGVMHLLIAISGILIVVFSITGNLGCAIGAVIDVAWFGVIEQIFYWIGIATGCLRFPLPFSAFTTFRTIR